MNALVSRKKINKRKRIKSKRASVSLINLKRDSKIILWQLLFINSISISLSLLLIKQGWQPISINNIYLNGSSMLNKKKIIEASGEFFPKPLLAINPKKLELEILRKLPIEAISINRSFLPLGLHINILEREPVAFAYRTKSNKIEKGMVDLKANWIPLHLAKKNNPEAEILHIYGWSENRQSDISYLLKYRYQLGSPLKKITLEPNGSLILQTTKIDKVLLGTNINLINDQIKTLLYLQNSLPKIFVEGSGTSINLLDPLKPEYQMIKNE